MKKNPLSYVFIILAIIGLIVDVVYVKVLANLKDIFIDINVSLYKLTSSYVQLAIMVAIHVFVLIYGLIIFSKKDFIARRMNLTEKILLIIVIISILYFSIVLGISITYSIYQTTF